MAIKEFLAAMTLKAKVIAVSTAVLVTGTIGTIVGIAVAKEDEYRVVKVFEMTGEATVERDGTGELSAYVGMNLENGDVLTVAEDSTLRISMDNDKYVLLDGGTVLKLNATGTSSDSKTKIELMRGEILNEITKPLSSNSSYEVATPKATMAVRGTSFVVKVEEDSEGGYITNQQTLQGKVEIELLSPEGKKTGKKVIVSEDKSVTIATTPNEESGNSAEIDGTSFFVIEDINGDFIVVSDPEEAVQEIDYTTISDNIKEIAIYSDDTRLMVLDEVVARKIRENLDIEPKVTTTPAETIVPEETVVPEVTTVPEETTPEVTTVPEETTLPEETTVTEQIPAQEVTTVPEETTTEETTTSETEETEEAGGGGGSSTEEPEEEVAEYRVEFVYNDVVKKVVKVEEGDVISPSDAPTVTQLGLDSENYYVTWRIDGTEFKSSYIVTEDIEVVADVGSYNIITFQHINNETDVYKSKWGQSLSQAGITPPAIKGVSGGCTAKWIYNNAVINVNMSLSGNYTFTAREYVTITFKKMDGSVLDTYEVRKDASIGTLPSIPTETGYKATSWCDSEGNTVSSSSTFETSTTLTPNYSALEYVTIKFIDFNDGEIASYEIEKGNSIASVDGTVPEIPTVDGYSATKWIGADGTDYGNITASSTFANSYTFKPNYTAINITIKFLDENGNQLGSYTIQQNTTLSDIPVAPDKSGYEFVGWRDEIGNIVDSITTNTSFSTNKTFTAEYEKTYTISYSITGAYFFTENGDKSIETTKSYNETIKITVLERSNIGTQIRYTPVLSGVSFSCNGTEVATVSEAIAAIPGYTDGNPISIEVIVS